MARCGSSQATRSVGAVPPARSPYTLCPCLGVIAIESRWGRTAHCGSLSPTTTRSVELLLRAWLPCILSPTLLVNRTGSPLGRTAPYVTPIFPAILAESTLEYPQRHS